jgi:nicotinate-nucleotide adenylyltransferase
VTLVPAARTRVAVFGGSFNPPHYAHVLAATLVRSMGEVDRILVVPTFQHAFGKPLAPFGDRAAMCRLAMGWIPGVEVSEIEADLGGDSLTVRTLEYLTKHHPDWSLRLVIGADVLQETSKWVAFDRVRQLAPPLVLGRAGVELHGQAAGMAVAPLSLLPELSSTQIRDFAAEERWSEVSARVPADVVTYLRARRLYDGYSGLANTKLGTQTQRSVGTPVGAESTRPATPSARRRRDP